MEKVNNLPTDKSWPRAEAGPSSRSAFVRGPDSFTLVSQDTGHWRASTLRCLKLVSFRGTNVIQGLRDGSVAKSIASKTGDRSSVLRTHVRRRALTPPGCPLSFLSAMAWEHACRRVCTWACAYAHEQTHRKGRKRKKEKERKKEV